MNKESLISGESLSFTHLCLLSPPPIHIPINWPHLVRNKIRINRYEQLLCDQIINITFGKDEHEVEEEIRICSLFSPFHLLPVAFHQNL